MVRKVITPGQSIDLIMQEAKRRGLDWFQPHHAAGMAGSFMQETGDFREDVINFKVRGDKNTAYGLMQWRGDRWKNLQKFAKQNQTPLNDIRTQISFAFEEMDPSSKLKDFGSVKAANQMRKANNPEQSAIAFVHAERPAGYDGNPRRAHDASRRINHAVRALGNVNNMNNNTTQNTAQNIPKFEYAFGKKTVRNQPVQPKLQTAITQSAAGLGISRIVAFSGGQNASGPNRIGSKRHNHGNATDIRLYDQNNKLIRPDDPRNERILSQYATNLRQNGVTGIGAGAGYMGGNAVHVGYGSDVVWGAGGRSANAPDWLKRVHKNVPVGEGTGNTQVATSNNPNLNTGGSTNPASSFNQEMVKNLRMAGFNGSDFGINSDFSIQQQPLPQPTTNTFEPVVGNVDFGNQQAIQNVDLSGQSSYIDFGQPQQQNNTSETPVLAPKNEVFAENDLTLSETFDTNKSMFGV